MYSYSITPIQSYISYRMHGMPAFKWIKEKKDAQWYLRLRELLLKGPRNECRMSECLSMTVAFICKTAGELKSTSQMVFRNAVSKSKVNVVYKGDTAARQAYTLYIMWFLNYWNISF